MSLVPPEQTGFNNCFSHHDLDGRNSRGPLQGRASVGLHNLLHAQHPSKQALKDGLNAGFLTSHKGSILVNALPWNDKVGLLFGVWITGVGKALAIQHYRDQTDRQSHRYHGLCPKSRMGYLRNCRAHETYNAQCNHAVFLLYWQYRWSTECVDSFWSIWFLLSVGFYSVASTICAAKPRAMDHHSDMLLHLPLPNLGVSLSYP
jgi:hypothetical protein